MSRVYRISLEVGSQIPVLRSQGKSQKQVGEELGVSQATVSRYSSSESLERARERRRARRNYSREHRLCVGGKIIKVVKRPRPDHCELCLKEASRLEWHHWDSDHLEIGMWLCVKCHHFVEGLECDQFPVYIKRYFELKEEARKTAESQTWEITKEQFRDIIKREMNL